MLHRLIQMLVLAVVTSTPEFAPVAVVPSFPFLASADARIITLEIRLPNGRSPANISVREGEAATVALDDSGQFSFKATALVEPAQTVRVDIYRGAGEQAERLDSVTAKIAGEAVESRTKPQFGIRVTEVVEPKP